MNDTQLIIFYAFALIAVGSAFGVLIARNVLYAAFMLMVSFFAVAAIYVFAGAGFIAVTQILVYIGGILVLIIFGLMITRKINQKSLATETHNRFWGVVLGGGIFLIFVAILVKVNFSSLGYNTGETIQTSGNIQKIGVAIMTEHIVSLELAAILLLIALIGAAVLSERRKEDKA